MKKASAPEAANFEESLGALERIVRELERGELPLERSLELFEKGVRLSRECQEQLNQAERRIEVLLRDSEGRPVVEQLDIDNDTDAQEFADDPSYKTATAKNETAF